MPGKKSRVRKAAEEHVRENMAIKALQGKPVAAAARELGIPTASAYKIWNQPETTSLVEAVTARRRKDLTTLFDRTVDSLLVDTLHLSDESSTLYERQSIRAEVLKVVTLCNPPKKDEAPQSQNQGPHITFQTLVQFVQSTSPPSTSNGLTPSPEPFTEKSPARLT